MKCLTRNCEIIKEGDVWYFVNKNNHSLKVESNAITNAIYYESENVGSFDDLLKYCFSSVGDFMDEDEIRNVLDTFLKMGILEYSDPSKNW